MGLESGDSATVDHISRNTFDNRKCNLRIASQTTQNHNQGKRDRTAVLPEGCGISVDEIPTHIHYIKPTSTHCDTFEVEINGKFDIPRTILQKKMSRAGNLTLRVKLQKAIEYLKKLRDTYPELRPIIRLSAEDESFRKLLTDEYNDIIKQTRFYRSSADLYVFKSDVVAPSMNEHETVFAQKTLQTLLGGRKSVYDFSEEFDIRQIDMPKYVQYVRHASRGNRFVIENHPNLRKRGLTYIGTTTSQQVSLKEKYIEILNYLDCLNKDLPIEKVVHEKIDKKIESHVATISSIPIKTIDDTTSSISSNSQPQKQQSGGTIILPVQRYRTVRNESEIDLKKLPKYMYYKPAMKERPHYFEIRHHPNLKTVCKATRTSSAISLVDKYNECISYLTSLDENKPYEVFEIVRAGKFTVNPETKEKERKYVHKVNNLPEGSDIKPNEIPEHVYYKGASGEHGSCFVIMGHPKFEGKKYTRSSIELTDREKLDEILDHLRAIEEGREFTKYKLVRAKKVKEA